MVVCICNALNEEKIKTAFENGCANCNEVMAKYECQFKCKKCIPSMHEIKKISKKNQNKI
jgi:bacterioferritin-associated ferredoxin